MAGRPNLQIFLCHASEDKEAVRTLYRKLLQFGFNPWLDEEKLLPGHDWNAEITRAIRAAHVVLVCLSQRSEKRGYVQKEIARALDVADEQPEGTIFLIPVRLEDCHVPDRLRRWQWVNLFEDNGFDRLQAALESRLGATDVDDVKLRRGQQLIDQVRIDPKTDDIRELAQLADYVPGAIPALIKILCIKHDFDTPGAIFGPRPDLDAMHALGRVGPSAIPALRNVLQDDNPEAWDRATIALAQIGSAAVPVLREALDNPDARMRILSAERLGEIQPPALEAVPRLKIALSDPDETVRNKATEALLNIGRFG